MKYHHMLRKELYFFFIEYLSICSVLSLILDYHIFSIFEQEVHNHSPNIVSDGEMDTMLKSNLVNWLQQNCIHII